MISVGSRDGGRKGGLSLRYGVEGGRDMELEEGEACFQNNNNNINNTYNHDDDEDDAAIDPDVALSYLVRIFF